MSTLLIALALALTSCPGPNCPAQPAGVDWRRRQDDPGRAYLFVHGRQVGGYDRARDEWRDFDPATQSWGEPRHLFPAPGTELNFGVVRELLSAETERHTLNGRPVSPIEARAAVAGLADDSGKLRLTIIGTHDERRAVRLDLDTHPELRALGDRLLVQDYAPDHWAVAQSGFVCDGRPTIYIQTPDGQVRHRQDEYRGPEKLAEAIRRADPRYRPELDPDLNQILRLPALPRWAWIAGIVVLVVALSKRRNPP